MKQLLSTESFLGPWVFEIASIVMAMGAVASMVVLLINFDNKIPFDGPTLTLNAIISTLSTTARVSLLAMLASSISQWNWLLFSNKPRRLVDFEQISAASRGPLGSLKVLMNSHVLGGAVVRAGALVTILTIALDPFAQQLVRREETRQIAVGPEAEASIVKTDHYSSSGKSWIPKEVDADSVLPLFEEPGIGMEIAIKISYADVNAGLRQHVAFNCPSTYCDFPPADSIAVCSRCHDITASLKERVVQRSPSQFSTLFEGRDGFYFPPTVGSTEYYLPNGLYLSNNNDDDGSDRTGWVPMVMFGTSNRTKTVSMEKIDTLIWAQSFIKVNSSATEVENYRWPGPKVIAQECALYYCVRRYTAVVRNGTLEESSTILENHKRIQSSWQLDPQYLRHPDYRNVSHHVINSLAWDPASPYLNRTNLELEESKSTRRWSITMLGVYTISAFIRSTFTNCDQGRDECILASSQGPPNGYVGNDGVAGLHFVPEIAEKLWYSPDLEAFFAKMASGISVGIRNGAAERQNVTGTVFFPFTVYKIAWPWIALHCLVTLGALVFLIITIWSTSKAKLPAWKTSELAVFSQGSAADGVFSGMETLSELEQKAKIATVVLLGKKSGGEYGVSGEDIALTTRELPQEGLSIGDRQSREGYKSIRSNK